jgi:hypothetical protein
MEDIKMKKTKFYSMVRENGAAIAKLQEGYTDGTYNYYKRGSSWFVIHPANGLSICTNSTWKAEAEAAHAPVMLQRVAAALERLPESAEKFAAAVEQAKGAAA